MHKHNIEKRKEILTTMKKAQGISNKVTEMIEKDQYCPEIIQQIDATIGLLKSARRTLLVDHLHDCLIDRLAQNKDKTIDELVRIYSLGSK